MIKQVNQLLAADSPMVVIKYDESCCHIWQTRAKVTLTTTRRKGNMLIDKNEIIREVSVL
jgi:hypothetical protein